MDRDVAGAPPERGRQVRVIGRREANLQREQDREPPALDELEHALDRVTSSGSGERVLHLGEADRTLAGIHAVRAVLERVLRNRRGDEPVQPRRQAREAPPRTADHRQDVVLDQLFL